MAVRNSNNLSPSTERALDWAAAATLLRTGDASRDSSIGVADLLVGVLLAHPDNDGEGTVLLSHFGLTARDVLPTTYPTVQVSTLRRWASDLGRYAPDLSIEAQAVLEGAQSLTVDGRVHLATLLGAILRATGHELMEPLRQAFAAAGTPLEAVADAYERWVVDAGKEDSASDPVAGRSLRVMLTREFPQRPVDLPTYASDKVGGGDLVGIRAEVDAFAYLLASRDLTPPLAVGLFGNWGSGKSFMMTAIRRRIEQIQEQIRDDSQQDVRFWKQIRQIEFNAWQYVQGSLWASLLDHILVQLGDVETGLLQRRRKEMSTELVAARAERLRRADRRKDVSDQMAERAMDLAAARRRRDKGLHPGDVDELRAQKIQALQSEASDVLSKVWAKRKDVIVGQDAAGLVDMLREARNEVSRGRALLGPYWSSERVRRAALVSAAFFASVLILAWVLTMLDLPAMLSGFGVLAAAVPTATKVLQSVTAWSRERLDELERLEADVQKELARRRSELDRAVEEAQRQFEHAQFELQVARDAELAALARADDLTTRLSELTPGRVLGDFLQERSRSADYRRHLGLLSMVRDDLRQLEDLVRQNNKAILDGTGNEGQVNRIILYIDDLDRCPDEKVLEVLEAVHLLLAFELFVVVVAVDSRWLRHALMAELPALADTNVDVEHNGHRATPQDYLEKIFQLPFWVQPLSDPSRASLVRGLLEGSVGVADQDGEGGDSTSALRVGEREERIIEAMLSRRGGDPRRGAQQLTLTRDELTFIESLAPLLGETPRGVKRFVNVFQLLSVLPVANGKDNAPSDRQLIAFLSALQHGSGVLARALFEQIEDGATGKFGIVVTQTVAREADRRKLLAWLSERPAWSELAVDRLRGLLPIIRRLSFDYELTSPPPSVRA